MVKKLMILAISMMIPSLYAHNMFEKLDQRMVATNSLVCVGLDPDITKVPLSEINPGCSDEEIIFSFLTKVIDLTAPHACAFKLQKAFYDQFDAGHELLRKTIAYIHQNHPDMPALVDCKIGDTDNTMKAYMHLLFEDLKADAVVVNPYMGDDVLEPFLQDEQKAGIILIQTSNPHAKIVQELRLANGKMLWEQMLELTISRWNTNKNLMIVLSSNTGQDNYEEIRHLIPQGMPILLAGIGAQGGNPNILKQLLDKNNRGVFVNSSRGILYPYAPDTKNWQDEVVRAVVELKNMLNDIRFGLQE